MLVDYGNQTQPTRQPSSISSQMLMANSFTPTYSQVTLNKFLLVFKCSQLNVGSLRSVYVVAFVKMGALSGRL